jgi:nitroimidazol reductase NimA-like FMN-containing flavoprotein (pyridoxamine 5'-phosphate oxidase superfamily)
MWKPVAMMRKALREIRDPNDLHRILETCDTCRLGLSDDGQPYIIPLNYGYVLKDGQLTLYFHCAVAGRKLEIINRNDRACFEVDCSHQLQTGETACQFSMHFESIIGSGRVEVITDPAERLQGLNHLMQHYSDRADWSFDPQALAKTTVLRLRAAEFCGKRLQK